MMSEANRDITIRNSTNKNQNQPFFAKNRAVDATCIKFPTLVGMKPKRVLKSLN